MNATTTLGAITPSITTMIRMDHAHVMSMFHRYRVDADPSRKRRIADAAAAALELHAQLEEEIFYPALQSVGGGDEVLSKSRPEHDEMRATIERLRNADPASDEHDQALYELQRLVLHHVADEETVLLPQAESRLADRLGSLGLEMTRRRLQLAAPRAGELAAGTVATLPPALIALAAGCVALGIVFATSMRRGRA